MVLHVDDVRFPCYRYLVISLLVVLCVVLRQAVEVTGNIVALANRRTLLVYDIKADKVTSISLTTFDLDSPHCRINCWIVILLGRRGQAS